MCGCRGLVSSLNDISEVWLIPLLLAALVVSLVLVWWRK